ncbi:MAG: TonB-dependent receptor [Oligoflexia bacterium]|nr:TonB-dependent receptor [Oligoflexia bacterium]
MSRPKQQSSHFLLFALLALALSNTAKAENTPESELFKPIEITVHADAISQDLTSAISNRSNISGETATQRSVQHFSELADSIPNLNWAGGSNRPRFFQIRGIGEREQYEGAPNSSVAFLIDDFDLSSLGGVGTSFDIEQFNVLKGPQGFGFGPSALAGLVQLKSSDPTPYYFAHGETSIATDDLVAGGLALSGPLSPEDRQLQFRLAAYQHLSDGFRDNQFLDRDDTNARDEFTGRAKLRWLPTNALTVDLNVLHIDVENGYDAFAIDNGLKVRSDRPGQDAQTTDGAALKANFDLGARDALVVTNTYSTSDVTYSYDGDWGNNPFWGPNAPYDYFSETFRDREVFSTELRALSNRSTDRAGQEWNYLVGLFEQRLSENSSNQEFSDGSVFDSLDSDFVSKINAIFGALEAPLADRLSVTLGLRGENRDSRYLDTKGASFSPDERMWGAIAGLAYQIEPELQAYINASRGYKGGGFNTGASVPADRLQFEPEFLWNFEGGIRGEPFGPMLAANLAAFYTLRRDQQIKVSFQDDPSDPLSFTYLTDNAVNGYNLGSELELKLRPSQRLELTASGAILSARFDDYSDDRGPVPGREQSHAPGWQYYAGARYSITDNIFARIDLTGKDAFYFNDNDSNRSEPYHLTNLTLGYEAAQWSWTVWAKNAFNQRYAVRGFFFGNEPPDFKDKLYVQLGDPRQIGTTVSFRF